MPSFATWISVYSTPPSLQSFSSSASIGREASEMSVSPAQNFSKPPPVPEPATLTSVSGLSSANSSAAASANGWTVLEPSIAMLPEMSLAAGRAAPVVIVVTARSDAQGEHPAGADGEQPLL